MWKMIRNGINKALQGQCTKTEGTSEISSGKTLKIDRYVLPGITKTKHLIYINFILYCIVYMDNHFHSFYY